MGKRRVIKPVIKQQDNDSRDGGNFPSTIPFDPRAFENNVTEPSNNEGGIWVQPLPLKELIRRNKQAGR